MWVQNFRLIKSYCSDVIKTSQLKFMKCVPRATKLWAYMSLFQSLIPDQFHYLRMSEMIACSFHCVRNPMTSFARQQHISLSLPATLYVYLHRALRLLPS